MVKLRLRRKGRRHLPFYDIVAIDGRKRRDGAFLERIGYFDPNERPSKVNVDSDRAVYWLSVGAQPSDVVRKLLQYEGVLLRKAMMHKGKSQEEIEAAVEDHKSRASERYWRKREDRKQKKLDKIKAEQEAKEAEAKAAEKPAAEAPAEG
ncbi:MAG: 30S ribosomal protein S16 [Candidatus Kapaibacterium sp.]